MKNRDRKGAKTPAKVRENINEKKSINVFDKTYGKCLT